MNNLPSWSHFECVVHMRKKKVWVRHRSPEFILRFERVKTPLNITVYGVCFSKKAKVLVVSYRWDVLDAQLKEVHDCMEPAAYCLLWNHKSAFIRTLHLKIAQQHRRWERVEVVIFKNGSSVLRFQTGWRTQDLVWASSLESLLTITSSERNVH